MSLFFFAKFLFSLYLFLFYYVFFYKYSILPLTRYFSAANIRIVDPVREFGSPGLGNVAWKERVDGWKMKQDKNVAPMTTSRSASERGGDIDAGTDVLVDESLLLVPKSYPLLVSPL